MRGEVRGTDLLIGYYNPMNYNVYSVNITLATSDDT